MKVEALKLCSAYKISETSNALITFLRWYQAKTHVEEVFRHGKVCPWRYATFTLAEAEIGRDHGWDLCEQAYGPFHIGFKGLCPQATSVVPR